MTLQRVTLKHSDFDGNTFKVRRTETRYKGVDGKDIYEVKETPKSQAEIRTVITPEAYFWITEIIQQMGHTDISCTENYYHRNRKRLEQKSMIISSLPEFCTKKT